MIKKITLSLAILVAFSMSAQAGSIVGKKGLPAVEKHRANAKRITLIKPEDATNAIKLVPLDEFLVSQKEESVIIYAQEDEAQVEVPAISEVEELDEVQEEDIVKEEIADATSVAQLEADEVYISYDSDKKTLLSKEAKEYLKDIVNRAQEEGAKIGVISYAAGEPAMARRVALLRANIIKNTLKSFGVHAGDIDVQSFGNQVNINQSKAFLVK